MQCVLKKVIGLHSFLVQVSKGIMYPHECIVYSGRLIPPDFTLSIPQSYL